MATKKTTKKSQTITDVEHPGKTAATATSKPVIVANRPIIKDPMMVEEKENKDDKSELLTKKTSTKPKIQPLEPSPKTEEASGEEKNKEKSQEQAKDTLDEPKKNDSKNSKSKEDSEESIAKRKAEHDANLQKIVDAKTYYLPINAVEKRKTKRFVVLGVLLSILLLMVWVDIALDAELIQIDGLSPLTSFF